MTTSKNIQLELPLGIYEKPKGNLYMLIKIEIWDEPKDFTNFKKEFCKKNNCLWIDSHYNNEDVKLPVRADYGEYWIEGNDGYVDECIWEICEDYHLHYNG